MPLQAPKLPFAQAALLRVPEQTGVFVLWSGDEPLYVGRTISDQDSLRKAIRRHLVGADVPSGPAVTHFSWEVSADTTSRHFDLVLEMSLRSWTPAARGYARRA